MPQKPDEECPYDALLAEWAPRQRVTGKYVASHPVTLREVMRQLDELGPTKTGDCIQSLVFELVIARNRAKRFAEELAKADAPST